MLAELREKLTARIRNIESTERTIKTKNEQCAVITKEIENATEKLVVLMKYPVFTYELCVSFC